MLLAVCSVSCGLGVDVSTDVTNGFTAVETTNGSGDFTPLDGFILTNGRS